MRRALLLSVLALAASVAACAGIVLPVATEADAARSRARYPGVTAIDLAHGRKLYQGHCSSCHQPVTPAAVPAAKWPAHISEMKVRARLTDAQAALVEQYLVTMASAPAGPVATTDGHN